MLNVAEIMSPSWFRELIKGGERLKNKIVVHLKRLGYNYYMPCVWVKHVQISCRGEDSARDN